MAKVLGILGALLVVTAPGSRARAEDPEEWKALFNGRDLAGWETWLGRPHRSVEGLELKRNDKGEYPLPLGLNQDPKKVFAVVEMDGRPVLRISGEIFGALTTREEFENYHLRCEFRWGLKKWPPRDDEKMLRDSGVLYHCRGEHGVAANYWMKSLQCQVQEQNCGDWYSMSGPMADVEAVRKEPGNLRSPLVYKRGAEKVESTRERIMRDADYEKPSGEWNTIEVLCFGPTAVHRVNGKVVLVVTNLTQKVGGMETPLTRGKLQLQSEGAEVYFRKVELRRISELPSDSLK
jgi:hypothetical protein